ncbi:MAG: ATP-binding cassette domain-containing protein [Chitinivibrionales bacterium]|nr:ATP-binding cassette domain-containing protein [Chitinivibrionales bacterium]
MLECTLSHTLHGSEGPINLSIDFAVNDGELIALYGKSGSGKTTILRMLAGLTKPDKGRIYVNGVCWLNTEQGINIAPQQRKTGLVFQDYGLFPFMTVRKNLEYGLGRGDDKSIVDSLLQTMGLRELARRHPNRLSGGQQQRVALARALAARPRMLLLDEALSALDPVMRSGLQNALEHTIKSVPVCTIMVSHDLAEIFRLSNKVLHIDNGKIIACGTPREVFKR